MQEVTSDLVCCAARSFSNKLIIDILNGHCMLATFFKVVSWFSGTPGASPAREENDIKETVLRFGDFTW